MVTLSFVCASSQAADILFIGNQVDGLALDETPVSSPDRPSTATGNKPAGWLGWIGARVRGWMSEPRQIGGDGTQWVHPSARGRYMGDPSFGVPANLAKYLASPEARIYGEDR